MIINLFLLYSILQTTYSFLIHSKSYNDKYKHIFSYDDVSWMQSNEFTTYNSINSYTSIPLIEQQALYDLYINTNGDNWIWKNETTFGSKWNFTEGGYYPCGTNGIKPFQGISCICLNSSAYYIEYHDFPYYYYDDDSLSDIPNGINITCNINKIYLSGFNMEGFIPASISNFKELTHLHLSYNNISSSLPTTIGNLLQLKVLTLNNNLITSTLPYELENLKNLTVLILDFNNINGSLPSSLGDLYLILKNFLI